MTKLTKKGLGKGLSALFGESNAKTHKKEEIKKETNNQKMVPIGDLNRNPYQPRTKFDEDKINELSKSIKQNGLIQPIAVRKDKMLLEVSTKESDLKQTDAWWIANRYTNEHMRDWWARSKRADFDSHFNELKAFDASINKTASVASSAKISLIA